MANGVIETAEDILRIYRDKYLKESDWVVIKALESGSVVPTNWKTYRQKLRDLPSTSSPKLVDGFDIKKEKFFPLSAISNVTFPTKPS
jgi:hypothetical protein